MRPITIALLAGALALAGTRAEAQTFSARRLAMGGVVLGATGANVAYRAVPPEPSAERSLALPLGLIQLLAHPPEFDSRKPDFNAYVIASLLYSVPWHLQIVEPKPVGSDIQIAISQSSLAVDLGDVKQIFPFTHSQVGAVVNGPALGFGIRRVFVGLIPVVEFDNDISLNPALHGALADAVPFVPNTEYALFGKARGQSAAGAEIGCALPLVTSGGGAEDRSGLYVGTRVKVLRGIAYGDADTKLGFITGDTLFSNPVDVNFTGTTRRAGPGDGGWGAGLDLGAVWITGALELGLGVNDIATQIDWKVRETEIYDDPSTGRYSEHVLADGVDFRSRIPTVVTVNSALQLGRTLLAGDVVSGVNNTQAHLGAELWTGRMALRAGGSLDANRLVQGSCGAGWRFGRFGLDLALASHSPYLTLSRAVELGVGLSLYQ
jgi:hypothetical protein